MSSEKQAPSALDLLGAIRQAISVEKRQAQNQRGSSKALKDLLAKTVGEFNKLCSVKQHRIDTKRKTLLYNLSLTHVQYILKILWGISIIQIKVFQSHGNQWGTENLQRLRAPPQIGSILHGHYDQFKHEVSGQVLAYCYNVWVS